MSERVGGRLVLEAGDAINIYERDADHEVVAVRRARIKHIAAKPGESVWHSPLGVFADLDGDNPAAPAAPAGLDQRDLAGYPVLDVVGRGCQRTASVSFIDDGTDDPAVWVQVRGPLALDELDAFIAELQYLRDAAAGPAPKDAAS